MLDNAAHHNAIEASTRMLTAAWEIDGVKSFCSRNGEDVQRRNVSEVRKKVTMLKKTARRECEK